MYYPGKESHKHKNEDLDISANKEKQSTNSCNDI